MHRESAIEKLAAAHGLLAHAQDELDECYRYFAVACREAHEVEIPDRVIAEMTGYSRARIQQFRCGDPRKVAA